MKRFGQAKPEFLAWAAQHDDEEVPGRSWATHQEWLSMLTSAVLKLDEDKSATDRARQVMDMVDELNHTPSII
ncbi:hypothetical protein [Pseudomonas violetae]|uniref:Uncharacterized protein n=1 Tax=Pseudomonas violetae TaxID=2915813 RepID=A0ABT0F166_9PSED|nr:hypothetical protein [Pseudomonas violetae]MCK1791731.1 hypothetical protein [Pseudomonas violetae]